MTIYSCGGEAEWLIQSPSIQAGQPVEIWNYFSPVCVVVKLIWEHSIQVYNQLFIKMLTNWEKINKKIREYDSPKINKFIWELEKLLCLLKLEAECVYSSEKMDVEVIFIPTDMAITRVTAGRSGQMKSEENIRCALSSKGK